MNDQNGTVQGADKLGAKLVKLSHEAPQILARAMYEEMLIEEKESRRRTPVEFGTLRASHETHKPDIGYVITCKITVGGPAAPYAIYVHENLEADHKVGQAKFLESTLRESKPFMLQRLAKRADFLQAAKAAL